MQTKKKVHKTSASDTESAFNRSAAPSPNLLRKQYPLRERPKESQFASRNSQESNTAVSSDSEDPVNSQPFLNIEERGRNREILHRALKTNKGCHNSSRPRKEKLVQGQSRHECRVSRSRQS